MKVFGVVEIVGGGARSEPVPDEEIEVLRTLMASPFRYDVHPYQHEGMMVEVTRGPLKRIRGILLRKEKRHRLIISVHLIRQAAAVEINASDVVKAKGWTQAESVPWHPLYPSA